MKRSSLIGIAAALSVSAAGAAAAILAGKKKTASKEAKPAAAKAAAKEVRPVSLAAGSYSFVSGFRDPATLEVSIGYDDKKFCFDVVSEDYLVYSSDSHVVLISGEDFSLQVEYAGYVGDDGFAGLKAQLAERHADLTEASYGSNPALRYVDGDGLCICLPAGDDPCSYLQVSVIKAKGNDDTLEELAAEPALNQILGSISTKKIN